MNTSSRSSEDTYWTGSPKGSKRLGILKWEKTRSISKGEKWVKKKRKRKVCVLYIIVKVVQICNWTFCTRHFQRSLIHAYLLSNASGKLFTHFEINFVNSSWVNTSCQIQDTNQAPKLHPVATSGFKTTCHRALWTGMKSWNKCAYVSSNRKKSCTAFLH